MAREISRRTVEGKWECGVCGATNLGRHRLCQSCGAPRGSTKVDLPDDPENAPSMTHDEFRRLADAASSGDAGRATDGHGRNRDFTPIANARDASDLSDWICEFCGASNGSWRTECVSCGNPREGDEVTYHEVTRRAEATGRSREDAEQDIRYERLYGSDGTDGEKVDGTDDGMGEFSVSSLVSDPLGTLGIAKSKVTELIGSLIGFVQGNRRGVAIGAGVLALLMLVVWIVIPHPRNITPESFDWTRNIAVSELMTVKEDDWVVPSGGRTYDQRLEHHYDRKVHDGWHDEEYVDYERQKTGTRTWTEREDNGDGSYDIVTYEEDVYENVPVTKTRRVEDYHYEPVYDIKYYYEIERWRHTRDVTTSGQDQNPYWGEPNLSGVTGEHGTGQEKEGGRTEEYGVTCTDGKRYVTNEEFWDRLEKGGTFRVLVHLDGHIEEYKK